MWSNSRRSLGTNLNDFCMSLVSETSRVLMLGRCLSLESYSLKQGPFRKIPSIRHVFLHPPSQQNPKALHIDHSALKAIDLCSSFICRIICALTLFCLKIQVRKFKTNTPHICLLQNIGMECDLGNSAFTKNIIWFFYKRVLLGVLFDLMQKCCSQLIRN